MTFIQPKKIFDISNFVIAGLIVVALVGTFFIIVEYNKTVDLQHNILSAKTQLQAVGTNNTQLTNQVIATLDTNQASSLAASDGLVADSKPQYFSINQQWPIASQ